MAHKARLTDNKATGQRTMRRKATGHNLMHHKVATGRNRRITSHTTTLRPTSSITILRIINLRLTGNLLTTRNHNRSTTTGFSSNPIMRSRNTSSLHLTGHHNHNAAIRSHNLSRRDNSQCRSSISSLHRNHNARLPRPARRHPARRHMKKAAEEDKTIV